MHQVACSNQAVQCLEWSSGQVKIPNSWLLNDYFFSLYWVSIGGYSEQPRPLYGQIFQSTQIRMLLD